jgi:hypothetical protein
MDKVYGWQWRLANISLAGLMILTAFLPLIDELWKQSHYHLSASTKQLVGNTDASLVDQLTYDAQTATYQFNKDAIKNDTIPAALQKSSVGAANKSNTQAYSLDVAEDFSKGVTYHDTNSQLNFSLIPQFGAMPARLEQGHLVFPLNEGNQAVYTLKNNGLKEDIIVPKVTKDSMTFKYTLNLPDTLEAKMIPGSGGAIGIYSADPNLFGDISFGSDKDQAAVENARKNGDKTFLVFGLPAPIIKTSSGESIKNAAAHFELKGNSMSVVAEHLAGITVPITIDPSVVVTSTSDFQTGNNEGNISFSTSGQLTRGGLTGGTVGGYVTTNGTGTRYTAGTTTLAAVYNGYMYVLSGSSSSTTSDPNIHYAPISASDNTLGTWTTGTAFSTVRFYETLQVYNGYLYMYGGYDTTNNTTLSDVQYAPINSDGSVGSWTTSVNTMNYGVCRFAATAYNGFLYATGGANVAAASCGNSSTPTNYVQYAPILANGDVGPWQLTTAFTTSRYSHQTVAYNGFLYVISGSVTGSGGLYDIQYAALATDGTISSWQTITSFTSTTFRYRFGAVVYNGYLYLTGGLIGTYSNDTVYAQINANGSVGAFQSTTNFGTSRYNQASVVSNGYLYILGGFSGSSLNDVQFAKIDPAGQNTLFTTTGNTALPQVRNYAGSVAYNGYVYVLGGSSTTTRSATGSSNVIYAPLSANGKIGAWVTGTTFVSSRVHDDGVAVVYKGYLYYIAGFATSASFSNEVQVASINATTGAVGAWADTTALTVGRIGPSAWAYNGNMYVAAGGHATTDTACNTVSASGCSDVLMAPIGSNGMLGAWVNQAYLPTASYGGQATTRANYVYQMSGDGATGGTVYVATMSDTGTISSWSTLTSFANIRTSFMSGIYNDYLYVWGNNQSRTASNATGQFTKLQSDGSLASDSGCGATWCDMQSMTSTTLGHRTGFIYQGAMYAIGGADASAASTAVESSTINNGGNGMTGAWTTNAIDMSAQYPNGVAYEQSFANNGYLYVLGGYNNTTTTRYNTVYYAPINVNGSIGTWTQTSSMTINRLQAGLAVYNGYVYMLDGQNTARLLTTEYSKINTDGTLGSWTLSTSTLSSVGAKGYVTAAAYNGYIYMYGGATATSNTNDVQFAPLDPTTGAIGAWTATTSFTNIRFGQQGFAYNGYMYVMGGTDGAGTYFSDVQYAAINSDGTLGNWKPTNGFMLPRSAFVAQVYAGYIYIYGGFNNGNTVQTQGEFASINPNGTLGNWQANGTTINTPHSYTSGAVYNGFLYLLAGNSGTTYYSDVQYSAVNSISRVARYSKLIDLGSVQNVTGITYNGNVQNGLNAFTYRAYNSSGSLTNSGAASTIAANPSSACGSNVSSVRYVWVSLMLDDSYDSAIFADGLGANVDMVTDFTINYIPGHPAPNIRLRAGQTLQAGVLSPLDTCGNS